MIIDGIKCRKFFRASEKEKKFYATIPLAVFGKLGEGSIKTKILMLIYCYGRMNTKCWFSLSTKKLKQYDLTKRQKNKVLSAFAEAGLLKLKKQTGKPTKIKLTII